MLQGQLSHPAIGIGATKALHIERTSCLGHEYCVDKKKGQFLKLVSDPQRTTLSLATRKIGKQLLFCLHSRNSYRSLHYLHQQVSLFLLFKFLSFEKAPSIRLPHHGISLLDLHCAGQKGCREPKVSVQGVLIVYHSLLKICVSSLPHHPQTPVAMLAQSQKVTIARPTNPFPPIRQSVNQPIHPSPPFPQETFSLSTTNPPSASTTT